jgi:hypothetical protein
MLVKHLLLALSLVFTGAVTPQDGKQTPRQITFLGTIKGEISKVSDGGRKIEVKYKELVTTTKSMTGTMTRGTSGKYRPPNQKELVFKEKNKELELRLLEDSVVRLLDSADLPSESKSSSKKRSKGDDESDSDKKGDDDNGKSSKKSGTKSSGKKPAEPQLPGKPGTPESLAKGQIIIVGVAREDMPNFSRLIATTIYVLGEK